MRIPSVDEAEMIINESLNPLRHLHPNQYIFLQ